MTLADKALLPPSIKFRVNDVSVSPFIVSGSPLITSNWTIHFTVANPNNKTINYESATVSLFYNYSHYYLSYGDIPLFSQSGKEETVVEAELKGELKGSSVHVSNKVSKSLTRDMNSLGALEFKVYVSCVARVEPETVRKGLSRE
ncbi:NDR1/HIN1-like protein 3 [Cornus florida]|uniref:NDR1/HIN1-like protein 3 n=1 Tax=Cornus florida TaxID=4283 RepID=UPI00289C7086|nr:NDR1/HIN1-like protein 3 [Cornus florida]